MESVQDQMLKLLLSRKEELITMISAIDKILELHKQREFKREDEN